MQEEQFVVDKEFLSQIISLYERKKLLEEELSEVNKHLEELKKLLMDNLLAQGLNSISDGSYTFYISEIVNYKINDKESLIKLLQKKAPEFLTVHHQTLKQIADTIPEVTEKNLISENKTLILRIRKK
jgi:hypothetical protein